MLNNVTPEDLESARAYDNMIPWEARLKRETPFLIEYLQGRVLDVACATGRHSFELEKHNLETVGIDISAPMIQVSQENAEKLHSKARFHVTDAAAKDFHEQLGEQPLVYDSAIMLGNAIANTESLSNAKMVMDNIFSVVRPGGIFVMQTIQRPRMPHYLPLRKSGEFLLQRIMIPVGFERLGEKLPNEQDLGEDHDENHKVEHNVEHNVELNVNVISTKYENQFVSRLYMLRNSELRQLATDAGWEVKQVFSSYDKKPESTKDGATTVWVLQRPPLKLSEETKMIFDAPEEEIQKKAVEVWEEVKRVNPYRSMQNFTFLHPRVSANPFLEKLISAESVLDVGCGVGADLRFLSLKGVKVDGIDITDGFMKAGEKLFGQHKGRLMVGEITGDVSTLEGKPVSELSYGAVHAGSVLHLVSENRIETLIRKMREIAPVFVGRTLATDQETFSGADFSIYSLQKLEAMFKAAGFKHIEIRKAEGGGLRRPSDREDYDVYFIHASA